MTRFNRIDRLVPTFIMVAPLGLALFYAPMPEISVFQTETVEERCETAAEPVIPTVVAKPVVVTLTDEIAPEVEVEVEVEADGEVVAEDVAPSWTTPAPGFLFVMNGALVLDHDADASWGYGRVQEADVADYWQWEKPARRKVLSPALRKMVTAEYELFDSSGAVCRGTVGGLRVVTRAAGDLLLMTPRTFELEEDTRAFKKEAFAAGPWTLEGTIEPTSGDCDGALWAREVGAADNEFVYTSKTLTEGPLHARAQRLFAGLDSLHQMAEDYNEMLAEELAAGEVEPFEDEVAKRLSLRLWGDPLQGRAYATVVYGVPGEAECGELPVSLAALWAIDGDTWTLVNDDLGLDPVAILDRGRDGNLELLGGRYPAIDRTLYTQTADGSFIDVESVTVPFIGCPC